MESRKKTTPIFALQLLSSLIWLVGIFLCFFSGHELGVVCGVITITLGAWYNGFLAKVWEGER